MRKSNLLKTILLTLGISMLAFAGCKDETCNHTYDNACDTTCNECTESREVAGHVYDNACDVACNECNTTRAIKHDYSVLQMNETHHWYICSVCEREDGENKATHAYDNSCDTACNGCETTRVIEHDYSVLQMDETHHWYICSVCERPNEDSKTAHTGEATCQEQAECTMCEMAYLNPENHTGILKYDLTGGFSHNIYYSCCDTIIAEHVDSYDPMVCYCSACEALVHILSNNCRCSGCGEYFHTMDETCWCSTCSTYAHNTVNSETGICADCNQFSAAVSVVIDGVKTYYTMLDDGIYAANGKNCTIIIENNCLRKDIWATITSGNIVVDLNGKIVSSISNTSLHVEGGTVTVFDSIGGGEMTERIFATGGILIVENGKYNAVDTMNAATVKIYGGEIGGISKTKTEIIKLYGGSFERVNVLKSIGTLADLLPVGYYFYDENGKAIDLSTVELDGNYYRLKNVTVGGKVEPMAVNIALKEGAKTSYYWKDDLTIDLSTLLNITDGAGEVTYTLTSSKGSINGSTLSCPLVANYTVTVTTAETATHKAGTFTFTITVESDPNTGGFDGEWVSLW